MRYTYHDLGHQPAGRVVTVRLSGSVCNVILLDAANFGRYRAGQAFLYHGGHRRRSPVCLEVPEDGHWYVVVDFGGYKGRVTATVEVDSSEEAPAPKPPRHLVLS
jgi:hypothetical protein